MTATTRLLACLLALATAMGIGRFALTPALPHLIAEGRIDLTGASLLAAANYLGYLLGALDALFARRTHARLVGGLWLCAGLTLASPLADGLALQFLLRFGIGLASAWVLVMVTGLSQPLAAAAGQPRLGALVFTGPGVGILISGVMALVSNRLDGGSNQLWLSYGLLASVATLALLPLLPRRGPATPLPASASTAPATSSPAFNRLILAYGLVGVGYILPATFLSQMAASRFHGQWQADLFWPGYGLAAALGVVLVSLRRPGSDTRRWLIATLWLQATGVLLCLLPGSLALLLGVLLCGGPFLASMQLVMQLGRELAPTTPQRNAGVLTASFASGQLLGPLLAAASSHFAGNLQPALIVAACGLVFAGVQLRRPRAALQRCTA